MANKLEKDYYVYDIENLSALVASMDTDGTEPGPRPKKSKWLAVKTAGKSSKTQPPPASFIESLLELEWVKNENLKMELEITKAQLQWARIQSASAKPQTHSLGQPRLSQATLTSTPWKRPRIRHPDVRTTLGKEETWVTASLYISYIFFHLELASNIFSWIPLFVSLCHSQIPMTPCSLCSIIWDQFRLTYLMILRSAPWELICILNYCSVNIASLLLFQHLKPSIYFI